MWLLILFLIIGVVGLIMLIAGIILAETTYRNLDNPWQVQVLVWGGLVILIVSVIIVAIAAARMTKMRKRAAACKDGGCGVTVMASQPRAQAVSYYK